jgi:hypothetical protein
MPPRRSRYARKSSRRPYRKVTRKRTSVSSKIKKYVKKQIHKNIENKVCNIEVAREFGSYLDSNTMNVFPMCPYATLFPSPAPGVLSNNRIGNEIRPRKVMLSYTLRPTPYNATFNPSPQPVHIQMYLGYLKQASGVLPNSADFNLFFNNGSSSYAPSGTLSDLVAMPNTDMWTILKTWSHKVGFASSDGTGINVGWSAYSNNDYKLNVVKKLDITKHIPKVIKFNDSLPSTQGRNLFLFYQAVASNGLALAVNIRPVAINYWIHFQYEDA